MSNILYHSARPLNDNSSGFGEFSTIDFEIQDNGRKLLKNSVYIEADVDVFKTGTTNVKVTDRIGINNNIGMSAFFETFSCDMNGQNVQNIQAYPRYCNLVNVGTSNVGSVFSPRSQAEGLQATEEAGRYVIQPINAAHVNESGTPPTSHLNRPSQLCIKPKIVLNSMLGDDYSFSKNGSIRVSMNLARNGSALYGPDVTSATSYLLKNVRLKYITVIDDGKQGNIIMNSVISVKQTMSSSTANFTVKVPSKTVTGVLMNYIKQSNETSLVNDSYKLENIPNLDEIIFLFSDSQSKFISYSLTDAQEMQKLGLEALSDGVKGKVNSFMARNSENVIHGLNFQSTIDLSNQSFGVNLKSSSQNISSDQVNVYMHFLTILSM